MNEPLICICGHDEESHDETYGYCNARACRCVIFRTEDDMLDDDGDGPSELDFSDDAA